MKKLLVTICFMFGANAGFLIEPYTGYRVGSLETTLSGEKYDYGLKGANIGARVGYTFLTFMAGIDYNIGSVDGDVDQAPAGTPNEEYDTANFGLFAGVQLPILLRGWATYYLNSTYEEADGDELSGSGFGLGVGFTGLPFVSLNLEYRSLTFDEYSTSTGTTKLSGDNERDANEIFVSVSLPLDL